MTERKKIKQHRSSKQKIDFDIDYEFLDIISDWLFINAANFHEFLQVII